MISKQAKSVFRVFNVSSGFLSSPLLKNNFPPLISILHSSTNNKSKENLKSSIFKPKLIIFDKDGTLICFHTLWSSWCEETATRMSETASKDLRGTVYDLIGYDQATKKLRLGLVAENTNEQVREAMIKMLLAQGFTKDQAEDILFTSWKDNPEVMNFKTTADLPDIFSRLQKKGIKIAVCTSDSREGTEDLLKSENVDHLVDMVMCGDDVENVAKPAPDNILNICKQLDVHPEEAFMIGDTPADTIMGRAANTGLTIGVLTGVGVTNDLLDADFVVDNVTDVVDLIDEVKS